MGLTLPAEFGDGAHIISRAPVGPDFKQTLQQAGLAAGEINSGIAALEAAAGARHPLAASLGGDLARNGFKPPVESTQIGAHTNSAALDKTSSGPERS